MLCYEKGWKHPRQVVVCMVWYGGARAHLKKHICHFLNDTARADDGDTEYVYHCAYSDTHTHTHSYILGGMCAGEGCHNGTPHAKLVTCACRLRGIHHKIYVLCRNRNVKVERQQVFVPTWNARHNVEGWIAVSTPVSKRSVMPRASMRTVVWIGMRVCVIFCAVQALCLVRRRTWQLCIYPI